ncbi:hypothetical protein [Haloferula rosea]|uniref:Uncharacterized protein n=1 Tax=Haloferula rosea TaxID=490093 RepID=A0A934REG8_9BACT|nr:hypothetical protein [Haloferula rosea]MBK1826920.1 hypothetical protein [Haloferula rosea]
MRLQQGQIWQKGNDYYRIVQWARHAIEYKHMTDLETKEGTFHELSKKEFCRLLKGAKLLEPEEKDPEAESTP